YPFDRPRDLSPKHPKGQKQNDPKQQGDNYITNDGREWRDQTEKRPFRVSSQQVDRKEKPNEGKAEKDILTWLGAPALQNGLLYRRHELARGKSEADIRMAAWIPYCIGIELVKVAVARKRHRPALYHEPQPKRDAYCGQAELGAIEVQDQKREKHAESTVEDRPPTIGAGRLE